MGERFREAYRSGSSKQQRATLVAPLWEEARVALVGGQHPASSSNGADTGGDHSISSTDVDQALKASRYTYFSHCNAAAHAARPGQACDT